MKDDNIKQNILKVSKKEFMEKGYLNASMRNISEKLGCTTGVLYNRFKTKDDIFDLIVKSSADKLLNYFIDVQNEFAKLDANSQKMQMDTYVMDKINEMIDIIYSDFDVFKLVICKSNGSKYESYIDKMVDIETENTYRFIDDLKNSNMKVNDVSPEVSHIIASALFNALFEVVRHDYSFEEARKFVKQIQNFYEAGWRYILGFEEE